ncbi:ParA family protein [Butyricicoccus sp.]|uniref:ParA family protein n=1 Tax=Butyricicoccus sp. TaxID=2049021 RepID=UPI003F171408
MHRYAFWNNKGGTGKTTLCFQTICQYAVNHPEQKVLAIDVCPQANLSELMLGGLTGAGSENLMQVQSQPKRATIGGYFQDKLPNPYSKLDICFSDYVTIPYQYNNNIPKNISMICGDPMLELQSNAVSTLANTQIPGTDTWIRVIEWVSDLVEASNGKYDIIFFDMNPSFSIFTQMALAASDRLVIPVMADDSSRRAIQNAFSLIYGFKLPHPIYQEFAFSTKMKKAGKTLPKVHIVIKNRLTQYMGAASAYGAVLKTIDTVIDGLMADSESESIFSSDERESIVKETRDFQTTGVVSTARGCPFFALDSRSYVIQGKRVVIKSEYLGNCRKAISDITSMIN